MSHSTDFDNLDRFDAYETWALDRASSREARRKRKPAPQHAPKVADAAVLAEIAEPIGLEGGFVTTYTPSRHEEGWLEHALRPFFEEELITDVLALVKGGKEANVYLCAAHPTTGAAWLAAKVYRPKMFRTLRNDALYRQGRAVLAPDGEEVTEREKRTMKALAHKSNYGNYVAHQSWMTHELAMLTLLAAEGLPVPRPYGKSDNAILMQYIGDRHAPAPTLNDVALAALHTGAEIDAMFRQVLAVIERTLQHGRIHGDLSAYNILYHAGELFVIDFPQAVVAARNRHGYRLLLRDVQRVCDYFARQGVRARPQALAEALWSQYAALTSAEQAADLSRLTDTENGWDHPPV